MANTYTVTIDPTRQIGKPPKSKISVIHQNLNFVTGLTINEMLTYTTAPYSYTISPSIFKGSRENHNWLSQHSFWLDFDSGISPENAKEKLKYYGIEPNIIYYTFSHTHDSPRFRFIILVNEPITNSDVAASIRVNLTDKIEGSDRTCKDAARIFLGGSRGEIYNDNPNSINTLLRFAKIQEIAKDGLQTRNLQKFNPFYNSNNRSAQDSAIPPYQYMDPRLQYLQNHKKNKFNFELAIEKIRLLKDFTSGVELKYLELIGLATNLIHVNGGFKFMKETMEKFNTQGKTKYKTEDFAILKEEKFNEYLPQRLEKFSPYIEDHKYTDIIDAVKKPRGEVQIINPLLKIDLGEAESMFNTEFEKAIRSKDDYIYIFSTQTAIGKTSKLLNLTNTTLAFPTHDLKTEVGCKMDIEHLSVPDLPTFSSSGINEKLDSLYRIGLNEEVHLLLNTVAYFVNGEYSAEDIDLARNYLRQISESYKTSKTILTTHLRALYDQYGHQTVIFDEDPIDSILQIMQFKLSDLLCLEQVVNDREPISKLIDLMRSSEPGKINTTNFFGIEKQKIADFVSRSNINSNLVQFFSSASFCKDKFDPNIIHYQVFRDIPRGKKVIILSATAQIEVYKSLYGDRVQFIDIPLAESKGKILQYTKNGYSRSYLKNNEVHDLIKRIGDHKVITFQKLKYLFPTAHPMVHFQNCEGYNFLKGENIAVVGTPHKNELHYLFTAFILGMDLTKLNLELQDLKIDWKGFRFRFTTYEDEMLRNIQLRAIERELVQAIGRARSLRTDAEVIVFSNLPLQICSKFN